MKSDKTYSMGIDFGTLSGRVAIFKVDTGEEVAEETCEYAHGVMDEILPDGKTKLKIDWALQHPDDYLDVLKTAVPKVIAKAHVDPTDIVGVGIDFTCCTIMPVCADGTPLCVLEGFKDNPHSYVKLWKHHAAQDEANKLNLIATQRGEAFLRRYGGKISSEWLVPKVWQVLDEAPEIYAAADKFIEAADWITWILCGSERRNNSSAGYKAIWNRQTGYPSPDFFHALDPRLKTMVDDKLSRDIYPIGSRAGGITQSISELTGLKAGTAVAIGNIDGHASLPGAGITEPGKLLIIMGTSNCLMLVDKKEVMVPGICGVVEDGILPGFWGYESGQPSFGDNFEWFVENFVPASYTEEAEERAMGIHSLLSEKASKLKPGQSGLIALDWWNGNRSVLVDANLSGMILGFNNHTTPEEVYRALIEASAFGTKMIIETHERHGININELYACGGIAQKNPFVMQVFSDVTNRPIRIADAGNASRLGAAIFGAVAAGHAAGGYDHVTDAIKHMAKVREERYEPDAESNKIYNFLFHEYQLLHDYFGRGSNEVMKRLKALRSQML